MEVGVYENTGWRFFMAKIVFISDIHHSVSKIPDVFDVDHINKSLTESLSENIYELLLSALAEEKEPADIIVFCGDYIIGSDSDSEKEKAMNAFVKFLEKIETSDCIMSEGSEKKNRIIVVPGNHDITRGKKKEIYNRFKTLLSRYRTPFTDIKDCSTAPTFIFDEYKLIIDCETTEDAASTVNLKKQKYREKVNRLVSDEKSRKELLECMPMEGIIDVPTVSAATSKRFKSCANKLKRNRKYDDYQKILVTHRALVSSVELGKPIKQYDSTIGGYDFMRSAMGFGYTLFVHGHIHQQSCVEITDYMDETPRTSVQLGVPALQRDSVENGIVVVDTKEQEERHWPFSLVYKSLSSYSYSFRQTAVLEGKKSKPIYEGDSMRILVDREITKLVDEGRIIINGDRDRVEAASYDCALGNQYKRALAGITDWTEISTETLESSNEAAEIVVKPHETVLIFTYEEFDVPTNMIMHASPISSWLRKGIRVELSLFVDPGFKGRFCFPVTNDSEQDITINSREPIMSIELIQLSQTCEKGWAERHKEKAERRKRLEE